MISKPTQEDTISRLRFQRAGLPGVLPLRRNRRIMILFQVSRPSVPLTVGVSRVDGFLPVHQDLCPLDLATEGWGNSLNEGLQPLPPTNFDGLARSLFVNDIEDSWDKIHDKRSVKIASCLIRLGGEFSPFSKAQNESQECSRSERLDFLRSPLCTATKGIGGQREMGKPQKDD